MRIATAETERRQGTRVEEEAVRDITGQLKHTTLCYCTQKAAQSALTVLRLKREKEREKERERERKREQEKKKRAFTATTIDSQ